MTDYLFLGLLKCFLQGIVLVLYFIQFFLERVYLTPQLQRILAADIGGKLLFLHPREVRHPAQVLQHNGFQFKLPDMVRCADGLALLP